MTLRFFLTLAVALLSLGASLNLHADDRVTMKIDGKAVTADEFLYLYNKNRSSISDTISPREYARMVALFKMKVVEAVNEGIDTTREFRSELASYLVDVNPQDDYLIQEYREGILLFEISNRRVWSKGAADFEALNKHFISNRDRYQWDSPRAKGWIISASDSTTAYEVKDFLDGLEETPMDLRPMLRKKFGMRAKAEKYLVIEGVNPVVDRLVFRHHEGFIAGDDWALSWAHQCRVIEAPEEWNDVRGEVTADYQELLSDQWEESLWNSHDVEFNYDVIDEITAG